MLLLLCSCIPGKKVSILELLPEDEVKNNYWNDDHDFQDIKNAVQQSLRYYRRLPDSRTFKYGKKKYTAREMEASMKLFLDIIEKARQSRDPYEFFIDELTEKFNFFESKNKDGEAFFTGYYEPILEGSLVKNEEFNIPLYVKPTDLVSIHVGDFIKKYKNVWIKGKVKGKKFVPYDSRKEIVYKNSLDGRTDILVFVKNHIELFFLQIQGSGLIRLRDGEIMRVNYSTQNGRPYRAIGRILKDKIPKEEMSLQSLKKYLYENPSEVKKILNYNKSYTFFRKVKEGPLGYIEVPLTAKRSIAMDRRLIPRGSLAFIQTTYPVYTDGEILEWKLFNQYVLVQDTGGAIKGHGRADIFWGCGKSAELLAGPMKQKGRIFLLVAKKKVLEELRSR